MASVAFKFRHPVNNGGLFEDPTAPHIPRRNTGNAEMPEVYNLRGQMAREMGRLADESLPDGAKARIREFVDECEAQGLSLQRRYFYLVRLRHIACMLGERFLSPSREDIRQLLIAVSNADYTANTVDNIKTALRRFYGWHLASAGAVMDTVGWIRCARRIGRRKPDAIITEEEFKAIVGACTTLRDRTLISLLYDSGCRISEILTLRIRDVTFDDYGAALVVSGKTGMRRLRLFGTSVSYLRKCISSKTKYGTDAFVFHDRNVGANAPMRYHQAVKVLERAAAKAGIGRRVHAHLFRHTRATLLAQHVAEAPLEAQMGWVHGSAMTRVYVHLSGRDIDRAILRAYGVDIGEEREKLRNPLAPCIWCGEQNPADAVYCFDCGKEFKSV